MEIVLAIMLFFGGLTLGSMQSSTQGSVRQADPTQADRQDAARLSSAKQLEPRKAPMCHTQAPIYRDLTLPRSEHVGDCEGGCQDE